MSYLDTLRLQLRADEGSRPRPYDDATGKTLHAGVLIQGNITIGIGRNLDAKPLSPAAISFLFEEDLKDAEADARKLLPDFDALTDVRKYVVCDMAFNLGYDRLRAFGKMLLAVHERRWADAADEILDSQAAREAEARYQRLSNAMRSDLWTT